jgi:hypothetical protein
MSRGWLFAGWRIMRLSIIRSMCGSGRASRNSAKSDHGEPRVEFGFPPAVFHNSGAFIN